MVAPNRDLTLCGRMLFPSLVDQNWNNLSSNERCIGGMRFCGRADWLEPRSCPLELLSLIIPRKDSGYRIVKFETTGTHVLYPCFHQRLKAERTLVRFVIRALVA